MGKLLAFSFLGFALLICGVVMVFLYITSIDKGNQWFWLIPSAFFVPIGIFFMLKAGKEDAGIVTKIDPTQQTSESKKDGPSMIERNNQLVSQWEKTSLTQNKLKLLSAAARESLSK